MVEVLRTAVLEQRPEVLDDAKTRWRLEGAVERSRVRGGRPFSRRDVNARLRKGEHRDLCISNIGDAFRPALRQQLGCHQRRLVPAVLADARNHGVRGRIGELVKAPPQGGGRGLGVESGGGDALVAEEAL